MMQQAPEQPSRPADLEARLVELERLLGHVLARAREHPVGRKVLKYLGIP